MAYRTHISSMAGSISNQPSVALTASVRREITASIKISVISCYTCLSEVRCKRNENVAAKSSVKTNKMSQTSITIRRNDGGS